MGTTTALMQRKQGSRRGRTGRTSTTTTAPTTAQDNGDDNGDDNGLNAEDAEGNGEDAEDGDGGGDDGGGDDGDDDSGVPDVIGSRVLEAFLNDPVLAERAVEIEADAEGAVLLHGRVATAREVSHAVTIAGGVPGVTGVRQRLRVRDRR